MGECPKCLASTKFERHLQRIHYRDLSTPAGKARVEQEVLKLANSAPYGRNLFSIEHAYEKDWRGMNNADLSGAYHYVFLHNNSYRGSDSNTYMWLKGFFANNPHVVVLNPHGPMGIEIRFYRGRAPVGGRIEGYDPIHPPY